MGVQLVIYNSFLNFMLFMVLTRPIGSQRPMLYGLSNAHKKEIPLRPILCMIKSPQSTLSTFLISVLEPVLDKFSNHTVPDSFSFVDKLKSFNLFKPNNFMVLFDIKSLFTNVQLKKVIDIFLDQLYDSDLLPPPFPRSSVMTCYVCPRRTYNSVLMISFFVKLT